MKNNIVVVILAGGTGVRLWPITTSKSTIKFLNKSLLMHNLQMIVKSGFPEAIIVTNPSDKKEIENIQLDKLKASTVVQPYPKGMADALLCAKKLIGGRSCLVMNAEDLVEQELYESIAKYGQRKELLLVGKKVTEYFAGGYFKFDGKKVVGIVEKPSKGSQPSSFVNLVFHYFPDPSLFFTILASTVSSKDDVYEKALSKVLTQINARLISYDGYWQPLKYPWHVLEIMTHLLNTKRAAFHGDTITIKSNVVIEGPVYLEDGVKIFENSKIVGPSYIGKNTIIGNNNIIRESYIGANCVTGFNTDITRSYIGNGCWFHSNYIGDSVLEENVSMGAGAVLANLRLDEKDIWSMVKGERINTKRNKLGAIIGKGVRLGVNVSIMPGVKVGKNSFIGAGVTLDKDLLEGKFCYQTPCHTVKDNKAVLSNILRSQVRNKLKST